MKKILIILSVFIIAIIVLVFTFISPLTRYLIEKNSLEWTGRKIEIGSLFINIFSGSVSVGKLKVYETDQKNLFLYSKKIQTGVVLPKLISGKYDVSRVLIDSLAITLIQTGDHFNYDDLYNRFIASSDATADTASEETQWWLRTLQIKNATLHYVNSEPLSEITLLKTNVSCPGISYNSPNYNFKLDCSPASGGSINADWKMNIESMKYFSLLTLDKVSISFLLPYLNDYLYVDSLNGLLSSSLALAGNLNKAEEIGAKGKLSLDAFSVIDTIGEKLAAIDHVMINMDSLNTAAGVYKFKEISVVRPYIKFAMYDDGYNVDRIMTSYSTDSTAEVPEGVAPEEYSNVFKMMADYIRSITESYLVQSYAADKLSIEDGHVVYTDYTLEDKFQYDLDSLVVSAENVSSAQDTIHLALQAELNRTGKLDGYVNISTADLRNMHINYNISNLKLSDVNPYSKFYVATPFLNGDIFYENKTTIHDFKLKSSNNLQIKQIKVGSKGAHPLYDVPIKLAVGLLTDLHGNIDLDVPVEGDLSDPKYKWGKVIWQVLENILLKAVTSPYRLLAKAFGGDEADYQVVYFDYLQHSLTDKQVKPLKTISSVLQSKPEMKVELVQLVNRQEEIENAALFNVKKEYLGYRVTDSATAEMKSKIYAVSNKDSLFNIYVDKKIGSHVALTSVQDKCIQIVGKANLDAQEMQLVEERNKSVYDFLMSEKVSADRLMIHTASPDSSITSTVPQFSINYSAKDSL